MELDPVRTVRGSLQWSTSAAQGAPTRRGEDHPLGVMADDARGEILNGMLIALLAVLGVDLIVIVVLLAFVFSRRRWVKRQPDCFRGVIRVSGGEIDGLRPKWGRGYGRWVSDVLVWTKAPFLFRNAFVAASGLIEQRPARPDEVKRLGDHPVVIQLRMGGATVEVAAPDDERELLLGPYAQPVAAAVAAEQTAVSPASFFIIKGIHRIAG